MAKGKGKRKASAGDVATNRQASFRYNLLDRWEAGIMLTGTEVKSLRTGQATMKDSYAMVRDGEVWLHNMHIPPYGPAARENHEPERPRKLLLKRKEIEKLIGDDGGEGADARPDPHLLQGAVRKGRDRARPRQGPVRQAALDQGARPEARHRARPARRVGRAALP